MLNKQLIARVQKSLIFIIFFFGFILLIYLLFYHLGRFPLENWDEGFYGQTTKEMLQTRDFIALHWDYRVWLEKPPMFMWITSLFSLLLGLSEFSIRLPSAISAFIIVCIATIYSYKKYSLVPALFTFFTLLLNNVFLWRARSGNIDLFVSLLILLSYFLLLSKNKYKYLLLGFIFFCIYVTKASLVFFPLVIFLVNEIVYQRTNIGQHWKEYVKFLFVFVGLSSIWLLLGYFEIGTYFLINYILHGDQGALAFTPFNSHYIQHVYYALQRRFFWVFLIGIFFALWNIKKQEYFLLIMYSCLLLFELSFTIRDNNWYLIPSMPFFSIIIGFGVYSILKLLKKNKLIYLGTSFVIVLISSYIFYKTYSVNILPIINSSSTIEQAQSAKKIKSLSKQNDIVVRLDPLIPTTLYYDDRKTLAYFPDTSTHDYWINTKDLANAIKQHRIKWLVGTNADVEIFFKSFNATLFQKIKVNNQEIILKVI